MAMLMQDNYLRCSCGNNRFEERLIVSFTKEKGRVKDIVKKTKTTRLECISCGQKHDMKKHEFFKDTIIEEE